MAFVYSQKVLFRHCDPAGIVFYPRYFEMVNDCIEAFFDEALAFPFAEVLKANGVPMAEISARFVAASRLGDALVVRLGVVKVGRASAKLRLRALCGEEPRFNAEAALVFTNCKMRPQPWPAATRETLETFLIGDGHEP